MMAQMIEMIRTESLKAKAAELMSKCGKKGKNGIIYRLIYVYVRYVLVENTGVNGRYMGQFCENKVLE
jgi:hypothetical protein